MKVLQQLVVYNNFPALRVIVLQCAGCGVG